MSAVVKHKVRSEASKKPMKQMFNRVCMQCTIDKMDLGQRSTTRGSMEVLKGMVGRMNNNPAESWNTLMFHLRKMSIPLLLTRHLHKLGTKIDINKVEVLSWNNGVGGRLEKKLKQTFGRVGSIADVQIYNHNIGEFPAQVSNSHWLAVNLLTQTCACRWW